MAAWQLICRHGWQPQAVWFMASCGWGEEVCVRAASWLTCYSGVLSLVQRASNSGDLQMCS